MRIRLHFSEGVVSMCKNVLKPSCQASQPVLAQPPHCLRRLTRNIFMLKFLTSPAGKKSVQFCSIPMSTWKTWSHTSRARVLWTVVEEADGKHFRGRADTVGAEAPDKYLWSQHGLHKMFLSLCAFKSHCKWGVSCSRDSRPLLHQVTSPGFLSQL